MPIEINSPDVVWIGGDLYCKTPEALAVALDQCRAIGYDIKDQRVEGYAVKEGRVTPDQMVQNGWSLWYANLDVRRAKCKSCNSHITTRGIHAHGNTCTACGAVTFRKIVDGSTVRFEFRGDKHVMFGPELNMKAKRWDTDAGFLYLKYEFHEGGLGVVTGEKAEEYLRRYADKWDLVEEEGEQLLKIHYTDDFFVQPDDVISMLDIWGSEYNASIVKVWEGVEYREYDRLPIPESFSVYETWHWAPLVASPTLHKRVLGAIHNHDDKGWFHQDGRPWFNEIMFQQMGLFIRNFTTLDADAWDVQSAHFRLDGPGGIDDIAAFCHPEAEVEDRPNIGNFVEGLAKVTSGQLLTSGEAKAMKRAWNEDRDTTDFAHAFVQRGLRSRSHRPLPHKIPRRLKKALNKPLHRRTSKERRRVHHFLERQRSNT